MLLDASVVNQKDQASINVRNMGNIMSEPAEYTFKICMQKDFKAQRNWKLLIITVLLIFPFLGY